MPRDSCREAMKGPAARESFPGARSISQKERVRPPRYWAGRSFTVIRRIEASGERANRIRGPVFVSLIPVLPPCGFVPRLSMHARGESRFCFPHQGTCLPGGAVGYIIRKRRQALRPRGKSQEWACGLPRSTPGFARAATQSIRPSWWPDSSATPI
jgi:hypothetical protein